MRTKLALAIAATLSLAVASPIASAKGGHATLVPAADIKWTDVEGFPGVKMAALQGDPGKGANHNMQKLPAGFQAPMHHHTSDHYVLVVSGTMVLTVEGKETKLPPGSYFAFTGKKEHLTKCEAGADCVLFVDARGKWDVVVPKGNEAKKDEKKAPAPKK